MGRIVRYRKRGQGWREDGRPSTRGRSRRGRLGRGWTDLLSRHYGLIALVLLCAAFTGWPYLSTEVSGFTFEAARQPASATAVPSARPGGRIVSRQFPLCGGGARQNCVVDGDTMWIDGEKIRISDIDTPEISSPGCAAEKRIGEQAKRRLRQLVNAGPFELRRGARATDRYGRALYRLERNGRSLGETLVAEGLAESWGGARIAWCT